MDANPEDTMRPIPIVAISLLATLGGCDEAIQTPLAPDTRSVAHAARNVPTPFKSSRYDSHLTGIVPAGCGEAGDLLQSAGDGTATHLGRYTITLSFCSVAGSSTLTNGQGAFVAANGDRLEFTFHGVSAFTPPTTIDFTSYATFVGGSGRFEHAAGSAVVTGTIDAVTGVGSGRWEGTITRP
jgi:hypothetical protein